MKTQTTLSLLVALSASTALTGCDPLENVIKASGANDPIGQMRDSGPYTAGSAVVEEIIVAEQVPAGEPPSPPPCDPTKEANRWRYNIYSECGNIIGSYGD
jgi:hypothetical protein